MNKNRSEQVIHMIIRATLALVFILSLAGSRAMPAYGQVDTFKLVLGGTGATPWSISNILPGESGTRPPITLTNDSKLNGVVNIWISNIVTDSAGTALKNYLLFNLSNAGLATNITLPAKINQLPQKPDDSNYLVIPLSAGNTTTVNWLWNFSVTGNNNAQNARLSFSINYTLTEVIPPAPPTPVPTATPAPTATAAPTAAPTVAPTTAPTQTPGSGTGLGLMVNTIPDKPVVGNSTSATDTSGKQLTVTGSNITLEKKDSIEYVNIPVALPQGDTLATYTDTNGTTFKNNQIVFTSFDNGGEPEVTVTINTSNATGSGDAATARVESMFLDVMEKSANLAPINLAIGEAADLPPNMPSVGAVSASINVTLLTVPQNAVIHSTITNILPADVKTALQLAVVDGNNVIDDIAFVMVIDKTNLPNQDVLGEARITMKVSPEYAREEGIENFRIFRFDETTGQNEVLKTEFAGYDSEGQAVFIGTSPHGLSVFALAVVAPRNKPPTGPTVVPLTVTPVTTPATVIDINILGKITSARISGSGKVIDAIHATDPDGVIILDIPAGSVITTPAGKAPRRLEINPTQITPPKNTLVIRGIYQAQAYLYDYSSNATVFTMSPTGLLTLKYGEGDVPGGITSLFPAYFDSQYGWIKLPPTVPGKEGNVSLNLRGALIFSMMGELGTPVSLDPFFRVSNLVVEPGQAAVGDEISASVIVANIGKVAGTFLVELKLDNTVVSRTRISLESGESRIVTSNFKVETTGIHPVEVAGLHGKVNIVSSRNYLPIALAGIFPVIIFLAYRRRQNRDEWTTGLKTRHWLSKE